MKSKHLSTLFLFAFCFFITSITAGAEITTEAKPLLTIPTLLKFQCHLSEAPIPVNLSSLSTQINDFEIRITKNFSPNYSCPTTLSANSQSAELQASTNFILNISLIFLLDGVCTTEGQVSQNTYLCLYNSSDQLLGRIDYSYNTKPIIPKITVHAEDEQVTLSFDPDVSQLGSYEICYGINTSEALKSNGDCTEPFVKADSKTLTTGTITNLANNFQYVFKARIIANQKPISAWSDVVTAKPTEAFSFTDMYDGDGPAIPIDGCNNQLGTSPSMFTLLGLAGILFLFRRRKLISKVKTTSFLLIFVLISFPASARLGQLNLSITGSPYLPNIDQTKNKSGTTINPFFKCQFGKENDPLLPLIGADLDVHLTDAFGSLLIGGGIAYTYASGFASKSFTSNACPASTNSAVGAHLFKIKLPQLTYILDPWVDMVPLAPYVRAGLVAAGYIFTFEGKLDKTGKSAGDQGISNPPGGINLGWEAAAGVLFMLDVFDKRLSANARGLGVYDHTFLKFEVVYSPIDNFGRGGGLNLSSGWPNKNIPLSLNAGLMIEFQ